MKKRRRIRLKSWFQYTWQHFISEGISELRSIKKPFSSSLQPLMADANSSLYRLAFALLFIGLFFLLPVLSFDFGRNSDETVSNNYGKDLLAYYLSGGKDTSALDLGKQGYSHMIYYGLSFDLLCAFINKFISPFGEFETRHILNVLFGLLAMLFASLLARRLANWRLACMVMLFMALTPTFYAHSMNNAKDIPFAAGYIVAIYYLVRIIKEYPYLRFTNMFFFILGAGFTGSNKINGWLLLSAYLGLFILLAWLNRYFLLKQTAERLKELRRLVLPLLLMIIAAYLFSVLLWPWSYTNIIARPFESLMMFEKIGSLMLHYELFDGELLNMENVPWYYTFKLLLLTLPLFVIAGLAILVIQIKKAVASPHRLLLLLLITVTFIPVLYAMARGAKLYNGWRHFLFIFPSLAVLSGLGWEYTWQLRKTKTFSWVKKGLLLLLAASAIKTFAWMYANQPHQVAYFNEFTGGSRGAYGLYELDPLGSCGKAAVEWILENSPNNKDTLTVMSDIESATLKYYASGKERPVKILYTRGMNTSYARWDYLVTLNSGLSRKRLLNTWPPKGTVHLVEAGGAPLAAIISRQNDFKYQGYQYFLKKKYDSSSYYFSKAVAWDSNDLEGLDLLAASLINEGKYNEAMFILNRSLNLYPENHYAWENTGAIFFMKGENHKAIKYFRRAIASRTNSRSALMNLGKCYFNTGNLDSAMYFFGVYDNFYPRDPNLFLLVAEVYKRKGEMQSALEVYNKALALSPGNKKIKQLQEEISNALTPDIYKMEFQLAMNYARENKLDSTIAVLSRIIVKDSLNYTAYVNRGVAWFQTGNINASLKDLDKAESIRPTFPDAYFKKGQVYFASEKYQQALMYFNKAVELSPDNPEIIAERGSVYFNISNFNAALEDFNKAININPSNAKTFYSRALTWQSLGRLPDALTDLNAAINIQADYFDAYHARAMIQYNLGKYTVAAEDLNVLKKAGYPVDPDLESELSKYIK